MTNPSYTAAYSYAADGLRLRVQESNAQYTDRWLQPLGPFGAGVAAQRVQPYDGVRPVLEGTLSGDVYTTTAKYVWEGNGYYSPLIYSMLGGTWRYHMYDGLGSTRQLMLHASPYTVTDTYSYEAFGNLLSSTGTTPNLARSRPPVGGRDRHGGAAGPHLATYRYVGSLGYYQTGNSLVHLGDRYYMPEIGRFGSLDPIHGGANPYSYVGASPLVRVDPAGLTWWNPFSWDRSKLFSVDCLCEFVAFADVVPLPKHPVLQAVLGVGAFVCGMNDMHKDPCLANTLYPGLVGASAGADILPLLNVALRKVGADSMGGFVRMIQFVIEGPSYFGMLKGRGRKVLENCGVL